MKILYCGSAKSVLVKQWCDEFVKRGHEVYLMTFHAVLHDFNGTKIIKVPTFNGLGRLIRWYKIIKAIRSIKPDVIHAHSLQTYGIIPAVFYKFTGKNIFSVVDCMGSDIGETTQDKPELKKKNNYIFRYVDLVTVKDRFAQARVYELGCNPQKTMIRPSFAEFNALTLHTKKQKNSFIFLRRFEDKYKSTNLFEVIKKVVQAIPDAKFIFAKRYGWQSLYSILTEHNLTSNIELIETDHATIQKYLAKANIYFDTFYSTNLVYGHGHGTTTIEAIFSGCKLVLPDRDEYNDFMCETYKHGDMSDLANALITTTKKRNDIIMIYNKKNNKKYIMDKFEKIYKQGWWK